jgi:hypothetical protein
MGFLSISEGSSGIVSNSVEKGLEGGVGDGSPNYRLNFGGRKTVSAISAVGAGGPISTVRPVGTMGTLRSRVGGR